MAGKRVPRPTSIKIGLVRYDVRFLDQNEWQQGNHDDGAGGLTYHRQQYIAVQCLPGSKEIIYQEVLFHELQHAIWAICMMSHYDFKAAANGEGDDVEETAIRMTTPLFMMVLRDNPGVFAYITSDGDHVRR